MSRSCACSHELGEGLDESGVEVLAAHQEAEVDRGDHVHVGSIGGELVRRVDCDVLVVDAWAAHADG